MAWPSGAKDRKLAYELEGNPFAYQVTYSRLGSAPAVEAPSAASITTEDSPLVSAPHPSTNLGRRTNPAGASPLMGLSSNPRERKGMPKDLTRRADGFARVRGGFI